MINNTSLKINSDSWKTYALGELANEVSVRVDDPSNSEFDRFVGLQNFVSGDLKIKAYETTEKLTSSAKSFRKGDVLFARRNAYLKRASLVDFDGMCSGDAFVLRENNNLLEPGFLAFIVNSGALWDFANSNAEGTMSKRVKWRDLSEFKVRLPSLSEQKEISNLLWSKNSLLSELENLSQKSSILRKTHFQNRIGLVECKKNGWKTQKLKEFATIVRGSSPRPAGCPELFNGDYLPWVTVGSLTHNTSPYLYEEQVASYLTKKGSLQTRIIPPDTVLLSNSGYSLGVPRILTFEAGANDGVAAFLDLKGLEKEYLYYFLDSITEHLRSRIAAGADQPNLNTTRIGNLEIPVPPLSVQKEIVHQMLAFDDARRTIEESLNSGKNVLRELLDHTFAR